MTHDCRNFILTIITAVYLVLLFAATLFGMNINTTTSASRQGFSNWTASQIKRSHADIQNSTKALVSTISSSGSWSYSWKTFIITAACLLISMPLLLTIRDLFRLAYRVTTYYVIYWRVFAIFPSVAFYFFSIFESFVRPLIPNAYPSLTCNFLLLLFMARFRQWLYQRLFVLIPTPRLIFMTFNWETPVMLYTWLSFFYFN